MKLTSLSVKNFRAIDDLRIADLPFAVVLAGPNGCGKSCILDAIRLLKSGYGSYQQDEWSNWFGEFQINLSRESQELLSLFQNPHKELHISADFTFSEPELKELRSNAEPLLRDMLSRELEAGTGRAKRAATIPLAANQRAHREQLTKQLEQSLPGLLRGLEQSTHSAALRIDPRGSAEVNPDYRPRASP